MKLNLYSTERVKNAWKTKKYYTPNKQQNVKMSSSK